MNVLRFLREFTGGLAAACVVCCLSGCGRRAPRAADLAAANAAALEQTVDLENRTTDADGRLSFEHAEISLGEVALGETRTAALRARNTMSEPLVVTDVVTSCGCTQVEWDRRPVPPGGEVEFRIRFTAEQAGAFYKKIAVRHSGSPRPVSFAIEGVVTMER